MIINLDYTQPLSDEHITVTDTAFVDIPVRLYLPKRKSEAPRRAVIYFHGGGFCFGSFSKFIVQGNRLSSCMFVVHKYCVYTHTYGHNRDIHARYPIQICLRNSLIEVSTAEFVFH